jgi:hypothetical protein
MTEPQIQLLDDLGAEFARVAEEHERSSRRSLRPRFAAAPGRTLAVALGILVMLIAGASAVPPARAAIEDLTSLFADWVAGNDDEAPGRALRPDDEAPDWVREGGGRLIADNNGVQLLVTRVRTDERGTLLNFLLADDVAIGGSIDDWRERFDDHAVVVLGPTLIGATDRLDERGRFPLLGVTAKSVDRVELRYAEGPPLTADRVDGGFVLMADARRQLDELVAYDAAGHELDRADVSHIDLRHVCNREPGCRSR